eukprot:513895-Heterocapsa_arctica.AAC.1
MERLTSGSNVMGASSTSRGTVDAKTGSGHTGFACVRVLLNDGLRDRGGRVGTSWSMELPAIPSKGDPPN